VVTTEISDIVRITFMGLSLKLLNIFFPYMEKENMTFYFQNPVALYKPLATP